MSLSAEVRPGSFSRTTVKAFGNNWGGWINNKDNPQSTNAGANGRDP